MSNDTVDYIKMLAVESVLAAIQTAVVVHVMWFFAGEAFPTAMTVVGTALLFSHFWGGP